MRIIMKSNCLFEAIKAKIKDPKNVKIHRFPITLNNNQLHFYWINESENRYIVKDNIEYAVGKNVPIWMFGFIY